MKKLTSNLSLRRLRGNIYWRQRVFLMKFILVTASGESEPVPRLPAYGCQTWSIRAACQHLPQLFDSGNLSNPNSNATSPTFMPFITSVEQAPQLCSHKHSQPQEGWRIKCKNTLLSIARLIKIFMDCNIRLSLLLICIFHTRVCSEVEATRSKLGSVIRDRQANTVTTD